MKYKIFILSGISLIGIFSFYLLFLFVNSKYEEHKNTEREESIREQAEVLKGEFEILESYVSGHYAEDCEFINSWNGTLFHKDLPARVLFNVNLEVYNNQIYPVDSLLLKKDSIIKRLKRVEILMKLLEENPEYRIEIRFVNDKSFGNKAIEQLYDDLGLKYTESTFDPFADNRNVFESDSLYKIIKSDSIYKLINGQISSAIYCYLIVDSSYLTWIILENNMLLLRASNCGIFSNPLFIISNGNIEINDVPFIAFDYKGKRIE